MHASSPWVLLNLPNLLSQKVWSLLTLYPGLVIPAYNGFGDETDSLGYVYRLDPKPPKKNFFKYVDNDKVILRYTARLNTTIPEDIERRFIISYFLADNTLAIYEPPKRNSGIAEGKFLERKRYKNSTGLREFIEPTDLAVGGNVVINSYSFQLLSADDYTIEWNKAHLA